jgi:hypothetical protein
MQWRSVPTQHNVLRLRSTTSLVGNVLESILSWVRESRHEGQGMNFVSFFNRQVHCSRHQWQHQFLNQVLMCDDVSLDNGLYANMMMRLCIAISNDITRRFVTKPPDHSARFTWHLQQLRGFRATRVMASHNKSFICD